MIFFYVFNAIKNKQMQNASKKLRDFELRSTKPKKKENKKNFYFLLMSHGSVIELLLHY